MKILKIPQPIQIKSRCDRQEHWLNMLIWGECSGSCGLKREIMEKEISATETELEHDCHSGEDSGCEVCDKN